jgi:hypothetical protein
MKFEAKAILWRFCFRNILLGLHINFRSMHYSRKKKRSCRCQLLVHVVSFVVGKKKEEEENVFCCWSMRS